MDIIELVERLGVTGVLVFMCVMFVYKFINTDKKVEAILKRYKEADNLKAQWKDKFEDRCEYCDKPPTTCLCDMD